MFFRNTLKRIANKLDRLDDRARDTYWDVDGLKGRALQVDNRLDALGDSLAATNETIEKLNERLDTQSQALSFILQGASASIENDKVILEAVTGLKKIEYVKTDVFDTVSNEDFVSVMTEALADFHNPNDDEMTDLDTVSRRVIAELVELAGDPAE